MFCGKSEELIRRLRRAEIAGQRVLIVKPLIDDRYDLGHVVSHAGAKMRAVTAAAGSDVPRLAQGYDAVGIDEVQFFDDSIVEAIDSLVRNGTRVVAAGLAQDFRGLPFGSMPTLLCVAEFVDKLEAVCHRCGGPATMTQRLLNGAAGAVRRRDDPGRRTRLVRGPLPRLLRARSSCRRSGRVNLPRYHRGVAAADALTLPFSWYSDEELLRRERSLIFARSWQYGGRADQVAEPGSFLATDAGGIPILVVRDRDGELRAFLNVCRHRGAVLTEGCGTRETIQCHYHAWTYDLDGSLRAAPRSDREPGFDKADWSLLPASVDTWGPFLFVNPSPDAEPLTEFLGELPAIMARDIDLSGLVFHSRVSFGADANWKIVVENFLECYHCPTAHPGFSSEVDVHPDRYLLEAHPDVLVAVLQGSHHRGARPVPPAVPERRHQRLPRPAEPVDRPDRPERHRPDRALPGLLLRSRRRRRLARGVLRVRRPGGPRGRDARRVRPSRHGLRRARAGPAAAERRAPARGFPDLGARPAQRGIEFTSIPSKQQEDSS